MDALVLVLAAGAVVCGAGCLLLRFGRRIARLSDAFVRLPAVQKAALVLGVTVATVSAQKGVTNGAGVASFSYGKSVAGGVAPPSGAAVSPADAARGYRLESVSTNDDLSYAMPKGAATVGTWRLTGAYDDVVRARLDGQEDTGAPAFRFPLGRSLCDALWAFTWGRVRPQLRNASNEIAVVGAPMSAIPGVSRLWTATTESGSQLLAWEDFALGRLPSDVSASELSNALVSARLELFPSGDFVARSNGVERVYRRVNPDDWDGDGISNERDGDPYVRADGDGGFGPHQDLSFTANTNAYCWVEVVVRRANARVTFVGDGPSDLPDPDFIAEAGATNRVTLLIGKEYRVSCAMPVEVAGKSSGNLEDYRDEDGAIRLRWPVTVAAQGDGEEMSLLLSAARLAVPRRRGFTMRVVPSGLGGSFTWTNCCCSISGSGYAYSYNCGEDCTCGGCAALGYFAYEGYRLPAYGGSCGCGSQGEDEPPGADDPREVGVSASFTKRVIFFEDEYENAPGETVPWRSTTSELVCSAYGGEHGGLLTVEITGAENLVQNRGLPLPLTWRLEPYERFAVTNVYRAVVASGSESDIEVTASFVEGETGWVDLAQDRATAVKVTIKPVVRAPENKCDYRHKVGVQEVVECHATPTIGCLFWRCSKGGRVEKDDNDIWKYTCPIRAQNDGVWVEGGGSSYMPKISVVEPCGVEATEVGVADQGLKPGQAGGVMLRQMLCVLPLDVSFSQIKIEEVPNVGGSNEGYFSDVYFRYEWLHGLEQGAGEWHEVDEDNIFLWDHAGLRCALPQLDNTGIVSETGTNGWKSGTLTWQVPCGWSDSKATEGESPYGTFADDALQVISIDSDGNCKVRKHGNVARRDIDGKLYLNGDLVK
ncbi:MAG: hypothetical protein ACI4RD_06830 [Kiritimatiellia bacterium]